MRRNAIRRARRGSNDAAGGVRCGARRTATAGLRGIRQRPEQEAWSGDATDQQTPWKAKRRPGSTGTSRTRSSLLRPRPGVPTSRRSDGRTDRAVRRYAAFQGGASPMRCCTSISRVATPAPVGSPHRRDGTAGPAVRRNASRRAHWKWRLTRARRGAAGRRVDRHGGQPLWRLKSDAASGF
jgi:hypothetical protein